MSKNLTGWTETAKDCFNRKMECEGCLMAKYCYEETNHLVDGKPKMKHVVSRLLLENGVPSKKILKRTCPKFSEKEELILSYLSDKPVALDYISKNTGLSRENIAGRISHLRLNKGVNIVSETIKISAKRGEGNPRQTFYTLLEEKKEAL